MPKWFTGSSYQLLAPTYPILQLAIEEEYTVVFNKKVLSHLRAKDIVESLRIIGGGKDVAILCYEKPEDFCHRHLVAEYLEKNLKINVFELGREFDKRVNGRIESGKPAAAPQPEQLNLF